MNFPILDQFNWTKHHGEYYRNRETDEENKNNLLSSITLSTSLKVLKS